MSVKIFFIILSLTAAVGLLAYFVLSVFTAWILGVETLIFHFNLYGEMFWETPLYMVILICGGFALLLVLIDYLKKEKK